MRLTDGTIVVAEADANELRFFDRNGGFLRRVGRSGEGPGEFRVLWWFARWFGDSLIAYDAGLRRFSVHDAEGTFVRSFGLPSTAAMPNPFPMAILSNGAVLGANSGGQELSEGFRRAHIPLLQLTHDGHWTPMGFSELREDYVEPMGRGVLAIPVPFGRRVYWAVGNDVVYEGNSDKYELRVRGLDGSIRRIIRRRLNDGDREVASADETTALDYLGARSQREPIQKAVARARRKMSIPRTKPAFGRRAWELVPSRDPDRPSLLADATGHLWVLEYTIEDADGRSWAVFDPQGQFLGNVGLPKGLEPLEIGGDYVLGWSVNELDDVMHIRIHRLLKGSR
jgi:hypothetical protein